MDNKNAQSGPDTPRGSVVPKSHKQSDPVPVRGSVVPKSYAEACSQPCSSKSVKEEAKGGNLRRQVQKANKISDTKNKVDKAVKEYKLTRVYTKMLETRPKTKSALEKFNNWVKLNIPNLDPSSQATCQSCGNVDFYLCDCSIVIPKDEVPTHLDPAYLESKYTDYANVNILNRITGNYNEIDMQENVNHGISNTNATKRTSYWFNPWVATESTIPDIQIDSNMYNYIVVNMHTYYPGVNRGFEAKIGHSHKLGLKYLGLTKKNLTELAPQDKARFMHTVKQAACQMESDFYYSYVDPRKRHFWTVLSFRNCFYLSCLFFILFALLCVSLRSVSVTPLDTVKESALILHNSNLSQDGSAAVYDVAICLTSERCVRVRIIYEHLTTIFGTRWNQLSSLAAQAMKRFH